MPHWVAANRASGRIVVTGAKESWVLMLKFDERTGALALDEAFRDGGAMGPRVGFDRPSWPHGETGKAVVHGTVFSK
jgi:hypothetical protein